jgi:hypothetical protein
MDGVAKRKKPRLAAHPVLPVRKEDHLQQEVEMPTVLLLSGWRLFFYASEGNEPIHIHCKKGDMECKYWLHRDEFEISEAYSYNMGSAAKREIRKIIFDHFEYIENAWDDFERRKSA